MKTAHIFSALFISATLLTTACTPRDVRVSDGVKSLGNKKGKNQSFNNGSSTSILGNNALTAFLVEKQMEAIELVKVATESTDQKQTQYAVEKLADKEDQKVVKISGLSSGSLEYSSDEQGWLAKPKVTLQAQYKMAGDVVDSLQAQGQIYTSVDSVPKGTYINLNEKSYSLQAKSVDENTLKIVVNMEGSVKRKTNKGEEAVKLVIDIDVDKKSLQTSDVQIVKINVASIEYPGLNGKTFSVKLNGGSLAVTSKGLCSSATGTVSAQAGPKNKFNVSFEGEEIKNGGWNKSLATCGHRPTVDIGRLLAGDK